MDSTSDFRGKGEKLMIILTLLPAKFRLLIISSKNDEIGNIFMC